MDQTVMTAVVAAVTTVTTGGGLLAMLFKGDRVVLTRELHRCDADNVKQEADHKTEVAAMKSDHERQVAKFEEANRVLQADLKEAHRVTFEQSKQVLDALGYIRDLPGLATVRDRRRTGG